MTKYKASTRIAKSGIIVTLIMAVILDSFTNESNLEISAFVLSTSILWIGVKYIFADDKTTGEE